MSRQRCFELTDAPEIGVTKAGQLIRLGAFSGLVFLGEDADGRLQFLTHTDRGPNPEPIELADGAQQRVFLLPDFQPRLVFLEAELTSGSLSVTKQIFLTGTEGNALTGIPPSDGHQEIPLDLFGNPLTPDPCGADLEGLAVAADGTYWMAEEYGPSVLRFSAGGKLLESLKPGAGLPELLKKRRLNRGFEGLALCGERLYAIVQSPFTGSHEVLVVEVDWAAGKTVAQFTYPLDEKSDRVGDITAIAPGKLLVIEQDGKDGPESHKRLYLAQLSDTTSGQERVSKKFLLDLTHAGIFEEKAEGVALVPGHGVAIAVDNDFGLDGTWDPTTGKAGTSGFMPRIYLFPLDFSLLE